MHESIYFIVSFLMDCIAIILSVLFYLAATKAEKESSISLAEIKLQTNNLQQISSRMLSKYTNFFTQQKIPTITDFVSGTVEILTLFPNILTPQKDDTKTVENLTAQNISLWIMLHFYVSKLNYYLQAHLPRPEEFDPQNPTHAYVKNLIDSTFSDFNIIKNYLVQMPNLQSNQKYSLYQETEQYWAQHLRTSQDIFDILSNQ